MSDGYPRAIGRIMGLPFVVDSAEAARRYREGVARDLKALVDASLAAEWQRRLDEEAAEFEHRLIHGDPAAKDEPRGILGGRRRPEPDGPPDLFDGLPRRRARQRGRALTPR